ncbi:hypothetical protein N8B89_13130 [Enterococcus faecium]
MIIMNFDFDLKSFIDIFVPVLTSFAVCFITLFLKKKKKKKGMKQQERQHEESLDLSKQQYADEKQRNEEQDRLSYYPYLKLIPKISEHRFAGKMVKSDENDVFKLPFELINEGLGMAFSIDFVYLEETIDTNDHEVNLLSLLSAQKHIDDSLDALGVSAPIDTDILRVGKKTKFKLYWKKKKKKVMSIPKDSVSKWEIKIRFSDFQDRIYQQRYTFITSAGYQEIHRLWSDKPQLID